MPSVREAVSYHSERVRSVIRAARSRINHKRCPSDPYVSGLAKAALGDRRSKCIEQITSFVIDIAQRGALEDAESIAEALRGAARAEWNRAHARCTESYADAWAAESDAQKRQDDCERAFALDPSETNEIRWQAAKAVYVVACDRLSDAMRREIQRRTCT